MDKQNKVESQSHPKQEHNPQNPDYAIIPETPDKSLLHSVGKRQPPYTAASIMRLQSQIGNRAVINLLRKEKSATIQRDLANQPPGHVGEYPTLTPEQTQEAIAFNNGRFQSRQIISEIQDIIGATQTGTFDEQSIEMMVQFQADFRLTADGKIGMSSLRPIVEELITIGHKNTALWMIVDGHNLRVDGLRNVIPVRDLSGNNAETHKIGTPPCDSDVKVSQAGFDQGYVGLVHSLAHEMEHVRLFKQGVAYDTTANRGLHEFRGEAREVISSGMLQEGVAGFMDDATNLINSWKDMTATQRRDNWDLFERARTRVTERFNRFTAAQQATHQATIDDYNAQTRP